MIKKLFYRASTQVHVSDSFHLNLHTSPLCHLGTYKFPLDSFIYSTRKNDWRYAFPGLVILESHI
jgi:hypothetical protein